MNAGRRSQLIRLRPAAWAWLAFFAISWLVAVPAIAPTRAQSTGTPPEAQLLSFEGTVEVSLPDRQDWLPGKTNLILRAGQSLRTGRHSRAIIRMFDLSVLRVSERTRIDFLESKTPGGKPVLNFKSGSAYLFNRTPANEVQFTTPLVMGAIRGTEFNTDVAEDGRTVITLLDGAVALNNSQGTLDLASGEQATVNPGQAPVKTAVLNAINSIQWSLYYPGVVDVADLNLAAQESAALKSSIDLYQAGDLVRALRAWPDDFPSASDAVRQFRAALLLSVGKVTEAEDHLGSVRDSGPTARALHLLIATVQGQGVKDLPDPTTASEWLAQSYYLQSQHQLDAAIKAARAAAAKNPAFGFAWVRVAELAFGKGDLKAAEEALDQGLRLSPSNAQSLALKGFFLAARSRLEDAIASFNRAIDVDSGLANAWLGRGLCQIRLHHSDEGRRDLETAAALEPNRSDLRSYLGKAWFERHDAARAEKELGLAQKLDPNDPTPWLYAALMHQSENRVNEAISELEKARDLNDNRAVYRSKLMLDQDQAVRKANLAKIYRDAGMEQVSVRAASESVSDDYANYSSHLFLANSYDALRDPNRVNLRYETPWLSELLMANLLAPVGAGAFAPTISQQDYSRLFDNQRVSIFSETDYATRGDWREAGSLALTLGSTSVAVSGGYWSQNGYRPNNDFVSNDQSLQLKQQITQQDSLYFQAQRYEFEAGDVRQYYDPAMASRTLRITEEQEPNLYLGWHHQWQPGIHTLLLASRLDDQLTQNDPAAAALIATRRADGQISFLNQRPVAFEYDSNLEAYSGELQQIFQTPRHTLVLGARYQAGALDTTSQLIRGGTPIDQQLDSDLSRANGYAYYTLEPLDSLRLTAGLSYDYLQFPVNSEIPPLTPGDADTSQWSPKAGIEWNPWKETRLRAAYTRSLGGIFYDNSVRLEPTQVAGFNQAFRSILPEAIAGLVPGTEFETWGVGWDQQFPTRTYLTVSGELLQSDADRTIGTLDAFGPLKLNLPGSVSQSLRFHERTLGVAVNQLVGDMVALGAAYRLSKAELEDSVPAVPLDQSSNLSLTANRDVDGTLQQLDLYTLFNHRSGVFSRFDALWSGQSNSGYAVDLPVDDFWQLNFYVGYRFPRRLAEVRLGLLNLTDQDYQLNPLNLYNELPHDRMATLHVKINF